MTKTTSTTKKSIVVPANYVPGDDEKFIASQTRDTVEYLQGERVNHPDPSDVASYNADRQLELRTKDRLRKLVRKIDKALARVEDGTYGYCDDTGDPISPRRLDARPIATLSLEAQELHERSEKTQAG
jgi:DnaK suppressor protein